MPVSARSGFSAQTLSVLAALSVQAGARRARAGARAAPAARGAVAGVVP
jgi:hypothetical protein